MGFRHCTKLGFQRKWYSGGADLTFGRRHYLRTFIQTRDWRGRPLQYPLHLLESLTASRWVAAPSNTETTSLVYSVSSIDRYRVVSDSRLAISSAQLTKARRNRWVPANERRKARKTGTFFGRVRYAPKTLGFVRMVRDYSGWALK